MNSFRIPVVILFLLFVYNLSSGQVFHRTLYWENMQAIHFSDTDSAMVLGFEGANYFAENAELPVFFERIPIDPSKMNFSIVLKNEIYEAIENPGIDKISGIEKIKENITIQVSITYERRNPFITIHFVPIRKNRLLNNYEKLVSFDMELVPSEQSVVYSGQSSMNYSTSSVLSSGNWYKLSVENTGVYIITYNNLNAMGINVSAIDPRTIRLYGNGGGMLPENNTDFRYDDLEENRIIVVGEEDGSFDTQDYILFYGESPTTWKYNSFKQVFEHTNHLYSDHTFYFLTTDLGQGKRVEKSENTNDEPTDIVTTFNDFASHEMDEVNLIKSGRKWLGEVFDFITEYDFSFDFPAIDPESPVYIKSNVVARSTINSSFTFTINGNTTSTSITAISTHYNSQYARDANVTTDFLPTQSAVNIHIKYNKSTSESLGWLNYIEVNARRALSFGNHQMPFRDALSSGYGKVAEFTIRNTNNAVSIWDVTEPTNVKAVDAHLNGSTMTFRIKSDTLHEFIAFDGQSYYSASFIEKVENQNLHGISQVEYIIITHPMFINEANRLAQHHYANNGTSSEVITLPLIYNEFSSGAQDISAIRNFVKMIYDRGFEGEPLKYLLLFGDGSYDNKNRMNSNTNFIPTYQSSESYHPVVSYVTDDYYGFLDDGEGTGQTDMLDIGIGRFPVKSLEEAINAVDKIIHYSTPSEAVMGDWRNDICFVADDEDSYIHFIQAENLANYVDTTFEEYNINKIYFDAYPQVSTPGGQRYPAVTESINEQVEKGALFLNYTGHGGEVGWAHERVLELTDINGWTNWDNMPVFVTATCEFSRFDDPVRTSAGEYVFLNPNGGGLALFTTTRATFGSPNYNLNKSIYRFALQKINGSFPTMGEVLMLAKQQSGSDNNGRKFILLGDPAQRLSYPEYNVVTTAINNQDISSSPDTINALSVVTIAGEIRDCDGEKLSTFNGTIHTTVFDKPLTIKTQANDGGMPRSFEIMKSILYRGKTSVSNGEFSFTFIVPKDIAYWFGNGKISYYAQNGQIDANGYYKNIIIGGYDENMVPEDNGPLVSLFMNDEYFINGGMTDENPVLLAILSDESGINTVGSGIGHDITAILDGNTDELKVLNEYYESDLNTYKSGVIIFPYFGLSEGTHQIKLKVWDVFNNSSDATIDFLVVSSENFSIEELINYPNPFSDYTYFTFQHNQTSQSLDVELQIFSITGQLVKTIKKEIYAEGYKSEPIQWYGDNNNGTKLRRGIYIYRVIITNSIGEQTAKQQKLIIVR